VMVQAHSAPSFASRGASLCWSPLFVPLVSSGALAGPREFIGMHAAWYLGCAEPCDATSTASTATTAPYMVGCYTSCYTARCAPRPLSNTHQTLHATRGATRVPHPAAQGVSYGLPQLTKHGARLTPRTSQRPAAAPLPGSDLRRGPPRPASCGARSTAAACPAQIRAAPAQRPQRPLRQQPCI